MQPDNPVTLVDLDTIGVGTSTGRPTALIMTEHLTLSKRTKQALETDTGVAWKPSKRPA